MTEPPVDSSIKEAVRSLAICVHQMCKCRFRNIDTESDEIVRNAIVYLDSAYGRICDIHNWKHWCKGDEYVRSTECPGEGWERTDIITYDNNCRDHEDDHSDRLYRIYGMINATYHQSVMMFPYDCSAQMMIGFLRGALDAAEAEMGL